MKLSNFLKWYCKAAGKPISFLIALLVFGVWLFVGLIFGFSSWWLLIINTIATINASLMVFIIQNTQTRESKALQIKLDELIRVTKEAENELLAIEELEEEELDALRKKLHGPHKSKTHKRTF